MAEPLEKAVRLPIATGLARAAIETTCKLLGQLSEGRRGEPAWIEAREAALALHLDLAAAEFEARVPRPARLPNGQG